MGFSSGKTVYLQALPDRGAPSTVLAETMPRNWAADNAAAPGTGVLRLSLIEITSVAPLTSIATATRATGFTNPTQSWMALYNSALGKLAVTLDDTALAWAGDTYKTFPLARYVTDAVITAGGGNPADRTVTSATAAFTATDVGKRVVFHGAGAAGVALGSASGTAVLIASVTNATTAVLDTSCSTTVAANGHFGIATTYTPTAPGAYYVGAVQAAATLTTNVGRTISGGAFMLASGTGSPGTPGVNGVSTGSLTDPTTAPTTAAALGATTGWPWVALL
jgi:hypothetical protein